MTDADENPELRPAGYVQSFERGLAVIRCFGPDAPRLTLTEVARRCDLTRAAARRYLITLESLGYVGANGREFFLLPRVLELGYAYLASASLPDVARVHLAPLARQLSESCSAAVLDRGDILYVSRTSANRIMSIALGIGDRLPAYCTAMGRVLLAAEPDEDLDAYLENLTPEPRTPHTLTDKAAIRSEIIATRERGWCSIDQEVELGVRSIALPIHDGEGVVAAMNVSAHASRMTVEELEGSVLEAARTAATAIAADLRLRR